MGYEFIPKGQYVMHAGEKGSQFYIILNGRVRVLVPQIAPDSDVSVFIEVDQLRSGSSFGELALLKKAPRAASIQCVSDSHFAVLDKLHYRRILGSITLEKLNRVALLLEN
jgi:CRP-like cAMP-binding protein